VLIALFLASTNLTIVGTALPRIIAELDGFDLYSWAFTGFTLASTISTPIYGRLSDSVGRKRVLLFGIGLFSFGSVAAGFSTSMPMLVGLRVVQGLGGGALMSMTLAVIADIFPPRQRSKYQGLSGIVWGASSVIGPVLGGFVTDALGWRWVFFLNVPVALAAFVVLRRYLPGRAPDAASPQRGAALDLTGAGLLSGGMLASMLALTWVGGVGPGGAALPIAALLGVIGLGAFALQQRHSPAPLLPLELFRDRTILLSNAAGFLLGVGILGATIYLPLYVQAVAGLTAAASGFALTPLLLGMILSGSVAGVLASRTGRYRRYVIGGLLLAIYGYYLGSLMGPDTPVPHVALAMFLLGLGLGPTNAMFLVAVQAVVPKGLLGSATSTHQFFRQVGGTLGVALFGALMAQQAAITFDRDIGPLVAGLPAAAVASVSGPDVLTDPARAAAAAQQLIPLLGAARSGEIIAHWRAGIGRGVQAVFAVSGFLAALALAASLALPAARLSDGDPGGSGAGATPPPPSSVS
jgi:EmrB/QacA subfamily drug resistance transporter